MAHKICISVMAPYICTRLGRWVQMDSIDQQLSAKIALINEHKRRRDMLMSFSKAPADFINGIVASQVRDSHMGQLIH